MNIFFRVETVTNRIYRITMPFVCCYLVVGKEKAVLIDSGWGYGDIKEVVESITDLPVTLVLSHGHPDHNGAASQFDEVYLNERDFNMIENQNQIELRRKLMLKHVPEGFKENIDLWQPPRTKPYTPLTEDEQFDLGDLTILPFYLPGHSVGSMVFIVPEERIAIFGDAISHPTILFLDNSSKVKEHYEAMVDFSRHSYLYDRVLVHHETFELDKIVLDNNIKLAKAIVEGKDEKAPATRQKGIYAARKPKRWLPSDSKDIGNIYYREDKL